MSVIILSGVSGSGKSHYAQSLNPHKTLSADDYFMRGGEYKFDASKLSSAHAKCFRDFIECVSSYDDDKLIVVDNTNTTEVEIAPYYLGAEAYGHSVVIHIMTFLSGLTERTLNVLEKRNLHKVPRHVIRKQDTRMSRFFFPPWWKSAGVHVNINA